MTIRILLLVLLFGAVAARAQVPSLAWATRGGGTYFHHITPDGRTLLSGNAWGYRQWDIESGEMLSNVRHEITMRTVRAGTMVSRDGRYVAVSGGLPLRIEEIATGEIIASTDSMVAQSASFSPDGTMLIASDTAAAVLYRVPSLDTIRVYRTKGWKGEFSPDGRRVARSDSSGMTIRDVVTDTVVWRDTSVRHPGAIWYGFADDGREFVAASRLDLYIWDADTGGAPTVLRDQTAAVNAQLLSHPDVRYVVSMNIGVGGDSAIRVYDVAARERVAAHAIPAAAGPVWEGGLVPGTTRMLLTNRDGGFTIFDYLSGEVLRRFPEGIGGGILHFDMSADAQVLAATTRTGRVHVGEATRGAVTRTIVTPYIDIGAMAISPDGDFIVYTATDPEIPTLMMLNRRFNAITTPVRLSPRLITATTFVGGSNRLLTCDDQGVIRIHYIQQGGIERQLTSPQPRITRAVASRDGMVAATVTDHAVDVWDLTNGALLRSFPSPSGFTDVALSDDGTLLVGADRLKRTYAFSVLDSTVREITALRDSSVRSLRVMNDEQWIVAGSSVVSLVHVPTDAIAHRFVNAESSVAAPFQVAVDTSMRTIAATDGADVLLWSLDDVLGLEAPSPADARTRIVRGEGRIDVRMTLERGAAVTVRIVDMLGRAVRVSSELALAPGAQTVRLDTTGIATGAYLVVVEVDGRASAEVVTL